MPLVQVTIKGIVEPQAICNKITKKTKRRAKIISPLPEAEGEPVPEVVTSHVSYGVRHAGHLPSVSSFSVMSIMMPAPDTYLKVRRDEIKQSLI